MSANEPKVVQIVGNEFIHLESVYVEGKMVYTIKHGKESVQLNKEGISFLYLMLENWLDIKNEEKIKIPILKANKNSSKEYPLGGDEIKENS